MKNSQGLVELIFWFRETNSKQDNFRLELRTMQEINCSYVRVGVQKATLGENVGIKNSRSSMKDF